MPQDEESQILLLNTGLLVYKVQVKVINICVSFIKFFMKNGCRFLERNSFI